MDRQTPSDVSNAYSSAGRISSACQQYGGSHLLSHSRAWVGTSKRSLTWTRQPWSHCNELRWTLSWPARKLFLNPTACGPSSWHQLKVSLRHQYGIWNSGIESVDVVYQKILKSLDLLLSYSKNRLKR